MPRLEIASATEQAERDALTVSIWGSLLTPPQFFAREQALRTHPWAKRTLTTYLWKTDTGAPLASCEAFLDDAHVGERAGTAVTIASVFTEPALRGRGHAANMLQALIAELRTNPTCLAITLFSEIGTNFYQRLGFQTVPAFDTFFPPSSAASTLTPLHALPAPRHPPGDASTLRLHLSSERLDWHLERERVYTAALGRKQLSHHGARIGESTITWTAYWKTNELQVLSLDAQQPEHLARLVQAASYAAHLVELPVVRIWETVDLTSVPDSRRVARTDEVAMFLPLVPGIRTWIVAERGLWA